MDYDIIKNRWQCPLNPIHSAAKREGTKGQPSIYQIELLEPESSSGLTISSFTAAGGVKLFL